MNFDKIFSVAIAIVVVAGITSVAIHPDFAKSITALGSAFSSSVKAAMGK